MFWQVRISLGAPLQKWAISGVYCSLYSWLSNKLGLTPPLH